MVQDRPGGAGAGHAVLCPGRRHRAPSPPSQPASISASATQPYTALVEVDGFPARVACVDAIVEWAPVVDHGNAVISYKFRMAEGRRVPSAEPWLPDPKLTVTAGTSSSLTETVVSFVVLALTPVGRLSDDSFILSPSSLSLSDAAVSPHNPPSRSGRGFYTTESSRREGRSRSWKTV